jgi:plastocyanin
MRRVQAAWVGVAAALLVAGVALAGAVRDQTVQITDNGFAPDRVDITVGQKVIFENDTQMDRSVTSKKPTGESEQEKDQTGFDSGVIKPATSWEHIFSKEGTYLYYCKEAKSMSGTVFVGPTK